MVAEVADWRAADTAGQKIKKDGSGQVPPLALAENPDILAGLAKSAQRPALLIGFAAETNDVIDHARAKLDRKGCDWIVANDVAADPMGGETNRVHIISKDRVASWDRLPKRSEEHTSELQSLMRISYAVFCLKKKNNKTSN